MKLPADLVSGDGLDSHLLAVFPHAGRGEQAPLASFIRGLITFMKAPPS